MCLLRDRKWELVRKRTGHWYFVMNCRVVGEKKVYIQACTQGARRHANDGKWSSGSLRMSGGNMEHRKCPMCNNVKARASYRNVRKL